jgi:hypothetical protein
MASDHAFSELLRAIGLVVVAWNQFERGFELLFSAVLPGDGPYSFVIMQALGGYPPRQDMLKVIAKYVSEAHEKVNRQRLTCSLRLSVFLKTWKSLPKNTMKLYIADGILATLAQ